MKTLHHNPQHDEQHDKYLWEKRYINGRRILITLFVIAIGYFSFLVLFPTQMHSFDFKNPQSSKNTFLDPHADDLTIPVKKGNVPQGHRLITDAPLASGDYSLFNVDILADDKFANAQDNFIWPKVSFTLQKAYRAFLLPLGNDIVSPSTSTTDIRSGALLSFADGVFLVDGATIRPIGDATIFEGLGYSWDDVRPTNEEELGNFTKGKIVLLGNTHPDGTVMLDPQSRAFYLIQDGMKHRIMTEDLAKTYLRGTHPIIISEDSLTTEVPCESHIQGWFKSSYRCTFPLQTASHLPGDSYRLTAQFNDTVALQTLTGEFTHTLNASTLRASLSQIKHRIMAHYGADETP